MRFRLTFIALMVVAAVSSAFAQDASEPDTAEPEPAEPEPAEPDAADPSDGETTGEAEGDSAEATETVDNPFLRPEPVPARFAEDSSQATPVGSLWDETQARVIIGMDGNARRVGDLITVNISEETVSELLADTSTSRSSETSAGIGSLFGLVKGATDANPNLGGEISMSVTGGAEFTGDGATTRAGSLTGIVTCEVVEVLPNNNLVVYGHKQVRANRETQYLVLSGTVRPRDIQADNTVDSQLLAGARIEFSGTGPVGDKQGPGVGQRVMDHAWPF